METAAAADDAAADAALFARRGCCCLWPQWTTGRSTEWERIQAGESTVTATAAATTTTPAWFRRGIDAFMKIREWSEIVAGPRWKTFIRRFGRNNNRHSPTGGAASRLNYDPLSYALNFDEGHGGVAMEGPDYAGYRDFSARFAAVPVSAKSSMDLSGRDGPSFFASGGRPVVVANGGR